MSSISVIMPCYAAKTFVQDALRSITRQDLRVSEIIVIDQDPESSLAACEGIRIIKTERTTPAIARNLGLDVASGDLVAFLDADDLWPAGKLARQVPRLLDGDLSMVAGHVVAFDRTSENGLEPSRVLGGAAFHVNLGTCIYRREALDRIGRFDPDFRYAEDVDMLLRVRESGMPFQILRSTELYYRQHPASMMAEEDPRKHSDFRLAIGKSLSRRRARNNRAPLKHFAAYFDPP
jgi:glycosyltransferase involved in cell wall biosynthesis